ncbi:hypothetical protein [Anaerosolibacter carboniphilus]|nr:hypothetical protein [Anaerosolibacter carboniphilus]
MSKKIEKIDRANYDTDKRNEEIRIAGGVSLKGFWISILIIGTAYYIIVPLIHNIFNLVSA